MQHVSKSQIKLVTSLSQKKYRDSYGLFVAEGEKCINELRAAFDLELLITPDNATAAELKYMSNLQTPQGQIAVFHKPHNHIEDGTPVAWHQTDIVLVLDGIQDPGNLGTIIRTADWFGVTDIFCSFQTADCFAPKVVQSTMGALARVRVHYVDVPEWLRAFPGRIYGTLLDGQNMYDEGAIRMPLTEPAAIIMGNEGNGITPVVRPLIQQPLFIPAVRQDSVESLNVSIATAILLAEFRRPRH